MELRDYQQAAHDAILRSWGFEPWKSMDMHAAHGSVANALGCVPWNEQDEVFTSVIAALGTSAGKTIIAAKLTETLIGLGFRVAIVADTNELCQQPMEKLRAATGIYATLEKADHKASRGSPVVIASVQTLGVNGRLDAFAARWGNPDVIIHDESHVGPDRAAVVNARFPGAKILGLTATPFKAGLKDLSKWYECVAFTMNALDLMKEGYVVPIKVLSVPIEIDLSAVKQTTTKDGRDYDAKELATTIEPYYVKVIEAIKEHAPKRRFVVFHPLVASSKAFTDLCQREGLSAVHCDGMSGNRIEALKAFEAGHFQIISNCDVFSKGVDFIRADAMLNLAPTRSVGKFRQRAGRIMRCIPGTVDGIDNAADRKAAIAASEKPDALIFDALWQTVKFGLAGPASIIASTEEEAENMSRKVKLARSEEDLANIRKEVQADREREILEAQERANKLRDKKVTMFTAEGLGALLHSQELMDYEPVMAWEGRKMSDKQAEALSKQGINIDTVKGRGHASKLLDAIYSRQKSNLAPLEAFDALKAVGVEEPHKCSLDDAIRILRENFPCTFGTNKGKPLCKIPEAYWTRARANPGMFRWIQTNHPVVYRWMEHLEKQKNPELI